MKHDQNICIECAYVGTCDGQPADDCDLMNLGEFETAFNDRLEKLDDQFSTIFDVLKAKKEAFIEMYRKNPKISHDEAVNFLQTTTESFDPSNPEAEKDIVKGEIDLLKRQLEHNIQLIIDHQNEKRNMDKQHRAAIQMLQVSIEREQTFETRTSSGHRHLPIYDMLLNSLCDTGI